MRGARVMEAGYASIGVIYYEQGIIQAVRAARGADALKPGESDSVSTVAQFCILLVLASLAVARRRAYAPLLPRLLPIVLLLALCFASAAWSDHPATTLRRASTLLGCMAFGAYLQQRFGLDGAIRLAGRCAVLLGVLSIGVFLAVPGIGRETALGYETAMRGVFSQKNPMAECMLLGLVCYASRALDGGLRWRQAAAAMVLLLCIALGRSATSLALAGIMLAGAAWLALRPYPAMRLSLLFGALWSVLGVAMVAAAAPDTLWRLIGRDASLTGRGPLWHEVLGVIADRPLLGHGYAGFWDENSVPVQYLWLLAGWHAPDSHDGYLEVAVELGLVGLLAYLAIWTSLLRRAIAAYRTGDGPGARFVLLLTLVVGLLNLDESPLPFANGFSMMLPAAWLALASRRRSWTATAVPAMQAAE